MKCQICQRVLDAGEPVYRPHTSTRYIHWPGSSFGSICADCSKEKFQSRDWEAPVPCLGCGRPVARERYQWRSISICSDTCRKAAYAARARLRRATPPRPCPVCAQSFTPKRLDSRYCSKACKQSAYRQRINAKTSSARTSTRIRAKRSSELCN
jgi:hypothetical protein